MACCSTGTKFPRCVARAAAETVFFLVVDSQFASFAALLCARERPHLISVPIQPLEETIKAEDREG